MLIQGIIRTLDELGRIVIPKEYRRQLNLKEGQDLELVVVNDFIVIGKARKESVGEEE
jgi:transcriptional pleiotropic regulator of transition state genes